MMYPHSFKTTVELHSKFPRVFIRKDAFNDMCIIVRECAYEVAWLGSVRRIGTDFLIEKIFLPQQEVTSTTCVISEKGLSDLCRDLLKEENSLELMNSIRFWGHSHADMETFLSSTDIEQFEKLVRNCDDYFICAVLNKTGSMKMHIRFIKEGYTLHDVAWSILEEIDDSRKEFWKTELSSKLSEKRFPTFWEFNKSKYKGYDFD